jgi:CxxC motif-containing protein (DUF1111 family)
MFCGLLAASVLWAASPAGVPWAASQASGAEDDPVARGRKLFVRAWESSAAPGPAADGLGPLFNERSCVACHALGGAGGAGPNDHNVELLTAETKIARGRRLPPPQSLIELHSGFRATTTIVLHKFNTNAGPYEELRGRLLGMDSRIHHDPDRQEAVRQTLLRKQNGVPLRTVEVGDAKVKLSERNTPPLFGLGLIDRIPLAELNKVAAQQLADKRGVSGRPLGRFGWRGQVQNLDGFVRSACAMELGLRLPTHQPPANPVGPADDSDRAFDISEDECQDLTKFVARLPRPRRLMADDRRHLVRIKNGEAVFESVGCADCHVTTLGNVTGIYSDLLLHQMGSSLEDPAPAPLVTSAASTGYYEENSIEIQLRLEAFQEWRTPPLWGLRDSAPYLHDGRAQTVEQAIQYHGGEAEFARKQYVALSKPQRDNLLAFLATLAAPTLDELALLDQ